VADCPFWTLCRAKALNDATEKVSILGLCWIDNRIGSTLLAAQTVWVRRRIQIDLMLIGRNYRKAISQGVAFALFRLISIWLLVGASVSQGQPAGHVGAIVIIAVDIIAYASAKGLSFTAEDHQREQWMNTLTNRFFYRAPRTIAVLSSDLLAPRCDGHFCS
jgi:hypothetical protein